MQQIINNKETTKSLADKYNIRRKTLSTWIAKYKRGKLNLSSGRPRIFDADSMQLLSSYVEENKDHLNVRQLGDYMEELYKNSITNSTTSNNNTTLIKPGKGINDVDTSDSGDSDTENKKDFCKKEDKRKRDQFKLSAKTKKRYIHLCLSGGLSKFIQGNSG